MPESVKEFLNHAFDPIVYTVLVVALFTAMLVFYRIWTRPPVALAILAMVVLFFLVSFPDRNFQKIITKPDNIPIAGLVFLTGFFVWWALRQAAVNDERIKKGLPPQEAEESLDRVLVWPDLVYTELISMVVLTVVLVVWSVVIKAPLEEPADPARTPNPSKAPWYFLGLQEMLVYFDPWIAGVVLPTMIITGLMVVPYCDKNPKGAGYYTLKERPFAIATYLFGFIVLWVSLIIMGTFLRGPNWNFFGPYEYWDVHKLVPLGNINLSEIIWVKTLNQGIGTMGWFQREIFGIVAVLLFFLVLPPLLAGTVFKKMFRKMGFIRYNIMIIHLLVMGAMLLKMVLRWTINLKYVVFIPEYFFNI